MVRVGDSGLWLVSAAGPGEFNQQGTAGIAVGLKDLNLKAVYYSDEDDLLGDFYVRVLSCSTKYDRIAGYFCSNSLAIAARGIATFVRNGGKMRLIASVVLSGSDQDAIREALQKREGEVLAEIEDIEDELKRDHVRMLGWMLRRGLLDMRIAVVQHGIEHQKIGILVDDCGDTLAFSGSDNETVQGWLHNDEQFHVFRSWLDGDRAHLQSDVRRFADLWSDRSRKTRTYGLSEAFKAGLIRNAPENTAEFVTLSERVLNRLMRDASPSGMPSGKRVDLRDYQVKAVGKWLDNAAKGILEMATGTGKTVTALACVSRICESVGRLAIVVTVPYSHLVQQWKKEVLGFGLHPGREIVADSTNPSWKHELADGMTDLQIGHTNNLLVYTTHNTFSSADFAAVLAGNIRRSQCLLVADEVHGTGAPKTQRGLVDCYKFRLGLSATPRRWFDDLGSKAIYDFFGDVVFEFTLRDAINTINPTTAQTYLTPYKYCPRFVSMTEDELHRYMDLTRSIVTRLGSSDEALRDELVGLLAFKRADIVKNADGKYKALECLLQELGDPIKGLIIYCSPEQIDDVMGIVNERRITVHRFTMSEGSRPSTQYGGLSEREQILTRFASGEYQALVAMKCLDEGVDVPPATSAIIMASSGNPREYIQRIGRVIRHYPGKELATIHDLVVVPSVAGLPPELQDVEGAILAKEIRRYEDIAGIAVNSVSALRQVYEMREKCTRGRGWLMQG